MRWMTRLIKLDIKHHVVGVYTPTLLRLDTLPNYFNLQIIHTYIYIYISMNDERFYSCDHFFFLLLLLFNFKAAGSLSFTKQTNKDENKDEKGDPKHNFIASTWNLRQSQRMAYRKTSPWDYSRVITNWHNCINYIKWNQEIINYISSH